MRHLFYPRVIAGAVGVAALMMTASVVWAEPQVRIMPERIEARVGESFEVLVTCAWRPSRDGNYEVTRLDPPATELAEVISQNQKASSDSEEGILRIEQTTAFRFKAVKAGEAVIAPARAEFRRVGAESKPLTRESSEALLVVRRGWMVFLPWVAGPGAVIAAIAAGFGIRRRRASRALKTLSGSKNTTRSASKTWALEVFEKIDEAKRFRFEGDVRRAMALLEEAVRLYGIKKYGSADPGVAVDKMPIDPEWTRWRAEISEAAAQVRFAAWKAPVEEQDRLIRGFESFVRTQKPEAL